MITTVFLFGISVCCKIFVLIMTPSPFLKCERYVSHLKYEIPANKLLSPIIVQSVFVLLSCYAYFIILNVIISPLWWVNELDGWVKVKPDTQWDPKPKTRDPKPGTLHKKLGPGTENNKFIRTMTIWSLFWVRGPTFLIKVGSRVPWSFKSWV